MTWVAGNEEGGCRGSPCDEEHEGRECPSTDYRVVGWLHVFLEASVRHPHVMSENCVCELLTCSPELDLHVNISGRVRKPSISTDAAHVSSLESWEGDEGNESDEGPCRINASVSNARTTLTWRLNQGSCKDLIAGRPEHTGSG